MAKQKRLLTLTEACDYIGTKKATMYNYISLNKIRAFKITGSRTWKFDVEDLDKWIEQQKQESGIRHAIGGSK